MRMKVHLHLHVPMPMPRKMPMQRAHPRACAGVRNVLVHILMPMLTP